VGPVGSDEIQDYDPIGSYDTRDPGVIPSPDFRYIPVGFDRILKILVGSYRIPLDSDRILQDPIGSDYRIDGPGYMI